MNSVALRKISYLLLSGEMRAYAIKGLNVVASFLATLILARVAGAAVVGNYSLAVATGALVGILATAGLDRIAMRQIGGDLREGKTGSARGMLRLTTGAVLLFSALLMAGYLLLVWLFPVAGWLGADPLSLVAAALGIAATGLFRVGLANVRGAGFPVAGQFYEAVPSLFFVSAVGVVWLAGGSLTAVVAVVFFFGSQLLGTAMAYVHILPTVRSWGAPVPVRKRPVFSAGFPVMLTMLVHQATDWLLLATISNVGTPAEVGAFRVAAQIMLLVVAIVSTGGSYVGTYLAADIRVGRYDLAWRRYWRSTILMVALAAPAILVCLFFPSLLLGTVFGPEFAVAGPALAIMAVGQAIYVTCGISGIFLVMADRQTSVLWQTVAALAVAVVLSIVLIPRMGLIGAAIAYAATIVTRGLLAFGLSCYLIPRKRVA